MAKKFIPPVDTLNNVTAKKSRRIFSDRSDQSVLAQAKKLIRDSYTPDAFEQVGTMKAVVLAVIGTFSDSSLREWKYSSTLYLSTVDKSTPFVEVRIRVPELHAHLPEPKDAEDIIAIDKHPIALLFESTGSPPVPGDIVEVDFTDKNNFKDGVITGVITANSSNKSITPPCESANVYNSATPVLNVKQPTGDTQSTASPSLVSNPAAEASDDGIISGQELTTITLQTNYFVTISEFNTMPEFRSDSKTRKILSSKNVSNVSIQIMNGIEKLTDITRLKKVFASLKEANIGAYLWITSDDAFSDSAMEYLERISKQVDTLGFFFEGSGEWTEENSQRTCDRLFTISTSLSIKQGYLVTEYPEESTLRTFSYSDSADYVYILNNWIDANEENTVSHSFPNPFYLYYLDGYNFLKTDADPCGTGERTAEILEREIEADIPSGFLNYDKLSNEKINVITDKLGNLQNLLSISDNSVKPSKAKLEDPAAENVQQKEEPSFNSTSAGTQGVSTTSAPANPTSQGSQCSPNNTGATSYGTAQGGAPPSPSFRFQDIQNFENKLWTSNPGRILNTAHVEFLDKLAAEVYKIIPLNDPIFASTAAKKLRVTDAVRTPGKQVELIWDKKKKKTDAQILSLYNGAWWVKKVLQCYPNDFATALATVEARVAKGSKRGGHLYGNGVDIGTLYNLHAEGAKKNAWDTISEADMKKTRFVKAVVQACRTLGASPVVEDYQEHIHITFPVPK